MDIDFNYTAKDFNEAATAKVAALTVSRERSSSANGKSRFKRELLSWLVFVGLALTIYAIVNLSANSGRSRRLGTLVAPVPTHNFLQTLTVASAAPLLFTAFLSLVVAKSTAPNPVPFYSAKGPSNRIVRFVWQIVGIICLIIVIGAFIAVFKLPDAPDWRPNVMQLFFVMVGPWTGWFFFVNVMLSVQRRRANKRSGNELFAVEGSSTLHPQHMEADDVGIVHSTAFTVLRYNWVYFVSYVESENLMTLYTRDLTMLVIPKRGFVEPGTFERFCGLVQTHIPAGLFLPRQSAFAVVTPVPVLPVEADGPTSVRD